MAFETQPTVWRFYHTKAFKKLLKTYHGLCEVALEIVNESIEKLKDEPEKHENEKSILEKLSKINTKLAVVMSIESVIGGVDTVSSAFLGTLHCLAENPEKQKKLRDEILNILPNSLDPLTAEKMQKLPYLRAVIKEGLRLYPPTIGNIRRLSKDVVLSGYKVPKGSNVFMLSHFTSIDEKNYELPMEFIPERWIKDRSESRCSRSVDNAHPFSYLPYGFGSRMCIGKRIAQLQLEVILMRIIRDYKVEWNYGPIKFKSGLINIADGEMKFKFTKLCN